MGKRGGRDTSMTQLPVTDRFRIVHGALPTEGIFQHSYIVEDKAASTQALPHLLQIQPIGSRGSHVPLCSGESSFTGSRGSHVPLCSGESSFTGSRGCRVALCSGESTPVSQGVVVVM